MLRPRRCPLVGAPADDLCPRARGAIAGAAARGAALLASDYRAEAEQVVRLLLLRRRPRLLALPETERCAYCQTAVRRAVVRLAVAQERDRRRALSLEALSDGAHGPLGRHENPPAPEVDFDAGLPLAQQIRSPELAEAFASLSPRERQVLDLLYSHQLSVAEAADRLGIGEDAVRQARSRAARHLRRLLPGWSTRSDSRGGGGRSPEKTVGMMSHFGGCPGLYIVRGRLRSEGCSS